MPNSLYCNDNVTFLRGCKDKTQEKLLRANITKVEDLRFDGKSDSEVTNYLKQMSKDSKVSLNTLNGFHKQARKATPGSAPTEINYLESSNPYQARYGVSWEKIIEKTTTCSTSCCVKHLVRFIHDKTRDAFKGTKYEDSYLFYHDALKTMTDKDCIEWMREEGILKRWILPEEGMNDKIVIDDGNGKVITNLRYKGRPVGYCPEAMPLDNSLFRDLRTSLDKHITLTCMLAQDDPRRFTKATPKEIVRCIEKIWNQKTGVAPSSKRIIQDIQRLKENLLLVVEADGAVVPGVCDRNGHRRKKNEVIKMQYLKNEDKPATAIAKLDFHSDCIDVCTKIYNNEMESWVVKNARRNQV